MNSAQSHTCIENRSDACKIRAAAQSGITAVPAWRGFFALLCILVSASSALAQRLDDFHRTFVMVAQSAPVHAAQAQLERQDLDRVGAQSSSEGRRRQIRNGCEHTKSRCALLRFCIGFYERGHVFIVPLNRLSWRYLRTAGRYPIWSRSAPLAHRICQLDLTTRHRLSKSSALIIAIGNS